MELNGVVSQYSQRLFSNGYGNNRGSQGQNQGQKQQYNNQSNYQQQRQQQQSTNSSSSSSTNFTASQSSGNPLKKAKPEYIYGINPVMACLSAQRRQIQKLYLSITEKGGENRKSHPKIEQIAKMASSQGIKLKYLHKVKLSGFTMSKPHQNVVIKASKLEYIKIRKDSDIEALKEPKKGQFYLFLDQITDPQNFGSILRTAMFIGVDGIIVNQNNACGLTPTVSKVSSGALEFIPLYSTKFVKNFMQDAQKGLQNFKIISTDIESLDSLDEKNQEKEVEVSVNSDSDDENEGASSKGKGQKKDKSKLSFQQPSQAHNEDGDNHYHEKYVEEDVDENMPFKTNKVLSIEELRLNKDENIILVLGSEGEGVSKTINKLADYRVMIPPQLCPEMIGKYPFNMVDSLNVGVSAGLLIYHIRYLMRMKI